MHPELWDNNRYVIFRHIGKDRTFDYLSEEKPVYTMHVRAVRFRLPQKINRDVDDLTKAAAEDRPDIQMQSGEKESGPEKEPLQGDENVSGVEESSKESPKESYADILEMPIYLSMLPCTQQVLSTGNINIGIYFNPHSRLSISSLPAYLKATSSLNTDLSLSLSLCKASRFISSVTLA